jgi:hypothetical protein
MMNLMDGSFRVEVLSRAWQVFDTLVGLERVKMLPCRQAGYFVVLEPVGDEAKTYIETLSFFMGQPSDLIAAGMDIEALVNPARRNGQALTYHQDLVSSWQMRGNGVYTGGAIRLHGGAIFSFSSSCTAEEGRQTELSDEAVVLCTARGLGMAETEEVKRVSKTSHNHFFEELWLTY